MTPYQQSELERVNQCLNIARGNMMKRIAEIYNGTKVAHLYDLDCGLKHLVNAASDYEKAALVAHAVALALKP